MRPTRHRLPWRATAPSLITLLAAALPARAGMPSLTLTDLAAARFQTISFFLLLFLLSALAVKGLWNFLRRDFPRLPRLTYGRALAVVGLWGLLFVLVLTMISGARELMTPGAWQKDGYTYKLSSGPVREQARAVWQTVDAARRDHLLTLKLALWSYADAHGGQFPPSDDAADVPARAWETSDPSRLRFLYFPGHGPLPAGTPNPPLVACEPASFPHPRLALRADGQIAEMSPADFQTINEQMRRPAAAPSIQGENR